MAADHDKQTASARILARAMSDHEFRRHLISEPHKALREAGVETRDDVTYKVVEDSATVKHIVLPHHHGTPMSEADLKKSPISANFTCF